MTNTESKLMVLAEPRSETGGSFAPSPRSTILPTWTSTQLSPSARQARQHMSNQVKQFVTNLSSQVEQFMINLPSLRTQCSPCPQIENHHLQLQPSLS